MKTSKWIEVDEAIHYTYDYVERPIWQALDKKFDGDIFNASKQIKEVVSESIRVVLSSP